MRKPKKPENPIEAIERQLGYDPVKTILGRANDAFREAVSEIETICRGMMTDALRKHYRIGQLAIQMRKDHSLYGDDALDRLYDVLEWAESTIANDIRLAEAFTPEQIDQFCETKLSNGHPLPYRHLTDIARLAPDERQPMIDRVVQEDLKQYELSKIIQAQMTAANPTLKRGGGRPLKAPRDFKGIVTQLSSFATDFMDRNNRVWETREHSISAKAVDLGDEQVTVQCVEDLRKMAADLRRVAIKASERADEADAVYQRFAAILERRENQAARIAVVEPNDSAGTAECDVAMLLFGRDIIGELPSAPCPTPPAIDPIYIYQNRPIDSLEPTVDSMPDPETCMVDEEPEPAMSA